MKTTSSFALSTPRISLAMLMGLLLAACAFLAPPTNALSTNDFCDDNPTFVWPRKKGNAKKPPRNCAWIKTLEADKKNKVCKKKIGDQKILNFCPDACGSCECPKEFFPKESGQRPFNGSSCKRYKEGLSCTDDYIYTGGCGPDDPIVCSPLSTYTCEDNKWRMISYDFPACPTEHEDLFIQPGPPVGSKCEPNVDENGCPLEEPPKDVACATQGLDCAYDYSLMGCTADSLSCSAGKYYHCTGSEWVVAMPDFFCDPWPDDLPLFKPCDPTEFCPLVAPEPDSFCKEDQIGLECGPYNYKYFGCEFNELTCQPTDTYKCTKEQTWQQSTLIPLPCVNPVGTPEGMPCKPCPREKVEPEDLCPAKKPTSGRSCDVDQYPVECKYDFDIVGCSTDELSCMALTTFFCNEGTWLGLSIAKEECTLECPENPPAVSKLSCLEEGYGEGQVCKYYADFSCTEGKEMCSMKESFTCGPSGWEIIVADPMPCDNPPSNWLKPCDPNALKCPEDPPPITDLGCMEEGYSEGKVCKYYADFSCTEGKEMCSMKESYTCEPSGWEIIMADPMPCLDPPPNWLKPCDPNDRKCPEIQPWNDGSFDCLEAGYALNKVCDYYADYSCTEGVEQCGKSESGVCTKQGWMVEMTAVLLCPGETPDSWGTPCDPNDEEECTCEGRGGPFCPGDSFMDVTGCNECSCGENGISICTKKACPQCTCEGLDGFYCPGESFTAPDGCNKCKCGKDGISSCTEMVCLDEPDCNCVGLNGEVFCDGDSYTSSDGCNTCVCQAGGHSFCTLRHCGPDPDTDIVEVPEHVDPV